MLVLMFYRIFIQLKFSLKLDSNKLTVTSFINFSNKTLIYDLKIKLLIFLSYLIVSKI